MRIALINSKYDAAGVNIRQNLEDLIATGRRWPLTENHTLVFHETDGRLIHQDRIDEEIDCDLIIFISRHSSTRPIPALTVHVTGNYDTADLGGEVRALAPAAPAWMHVILQNLSERAPDGYRVSYEVTHHGPTTLSTPSLFAEIGSTAKEWTDPDAGKVMAESILHAAPKETINLIGFGGTHYAVRQTEIALASRGAFGHIAPARQIRSLDPDLVRQMQEKSDAVAAYIDRKTLSADEFSEIEKMIDCTGVVLLSESEILEIKDLEWNTYLKIRDLAEEITPGSRIHIHSLSGRGTPASIYLSKNLIGEVTKTSKGEFIEALGRLPVVHLSKGSTEVLPHFIGFEAETSQLARDITTLCVKLLLTCEGTVIAGDHLILQKVQFDPKEARRHGVPEGPLFATLAGGESVEIDGREITPDMVHTISSRRIHIPGLERYI